MTIRPKAAAWKPISYSMLGCIGPPQPGQRGKAAAASGETVMPHGRSVGVPSGSSDRKQPTRPMASASGMAAA